MCNLLFAVPAEVLVALGAMHFVAPVDFFDCGVACWAGPKFQPIALSKEIEIKVVLALTLVPLLPAFETGRLGAPSTHGSVAAAAWLVEQRVAIRCGAILNSFVCRDHKLLVGLFENSFQLFRHSKRFDILQIEMKGTAVLHAADFFRATLDRCFDVVHRAVIAKGVLTLG